MWDQEGLRYELQCLARQSLPGPPLNSLGGAGVIVETNGDKMGTKARGYSGTTSAYFSLLLIYPAVNRTPSMNPTPIGSDKVSLGS